MEQTHPFVAASKSKLRFEVGRGYVSVEDLWDFSLKDLDTVAVTIDSTLQGSRKSFLDNPDRRETALQKEQELRLECLKIVIDQKQTENREKRAKSELRAREAFLEELLKKKKLDQLESLDIGDIERQLAELRGEATNEQGPAAEATA